MSLDIQAGADPSPRPKAPAKAPAGKRYPVAKPAVAVPKVREGEELEKADLVEDLLSPPSIRSFAISLSAHAVLLLILAFWYFAPIEPIQKIIDTRLAGSELGDPSGDQLKGALGMDTPLAMPASPDGPVLQAVPEDRITSLPVQDLPSPQSNRQPKDGQGAANGGGVNLANPGGAGNGDGFGVAKFGQGGETINGVDVKVGDPQWTLIWDSRADIDIHVVEPGGSEIYWENRNGGQGGELDVDDVDGFGPENVNYVQGKGPPGNYTWWVYYYGGLGGIAQHTRWKVRVKHAGQVKVYEGKFSAIGDKSRIYTLKVEPDAPKPGAKPPAARETPEGGEITAARPPAAPANAPTPAGPSVFTPAGGGFSVKLPAEPKAGRKDWETPIGPVVGQTFSHDGSDGGLTITTLDFPSATIAKADPSKLLDDIAVKVVSHEKGAATRTTKIALSGSAGREVEFTVPESVVAGGGVGKARVYLAGNRLLILSAVGAKSFLEGSDATEAFKTFAISGAR